MAVTVLPCFVIALPAVAANPSPTALYRTLFKMRVPLSQLPPGFHDPKVGSSTPIGDATKHGAIGEVDLMLNSANVLISYIVFPNRVDALANYAGEAKGNRAPPTAFRSLPKPARVLVTRAGTETELVDQNVAIYVVTRSALVPTDLVRFAIRHLQEAEAATPR